MIQWQVAKVRIGFASFLIASACPMIALASADRDDGARWEATQSTQLIGRAEPPPLGRLGSLQEGFEENRGQFPAEIRFVLRSAAGAVLFLDDAFVIATAGETTRFDLGRISGQAGHPEGRSALPTAVTSVRGTDLAGSSRGVRRFAEVGYRGPRGVDLVFYRDGNGELEYDVHLAAGADHGSLRIRVDGAEKLDMDAAGNLIVVTSCGEIVQWLPVLRGEDGRESGAVARYEVGKEEFSLSVSGRDASQALIVDPVLSYSTYLGGSVDDALLGMAVDAAGNVYVTGWTSSIDFPTQDPRQPANQGRTDAFVAKIDPTGSFLVYATYLGGSLGDNGGAIAVDSTGNTVIAGDTSSTDFPIVNAFQTGLGNPTDAFVTKLSPDGSQLVFSTYLGGSIQPTMGTCENGTAIAVDRQDDIYMAGNTCASDFPVLNPFQASYAGGSTISDQGDGFATKWSATGALLYSTYLGGSSAEGISSIAIDDGGGAVVVGSTKSFDFPTRDPLFPFLAGNVDGFIAKLTAAGDELAFSSYLGGTGVDRCASVALGPLGDAYITGLTDSVDFPVVRALQPAIGGQQDGFAARLDADGTRLAWSTYLGGSANERLGAGALDAAGNFWVSGFSQSVDAPLRAPIQAVNNGAGDAYVAEIDPTATWLVFATYLGGSDWEHNVSIGLDAAGAAYSAGITASSDFPTVNPIQTSFAGGSFWGDGVIAKLVCPDLLPGPVGNTLTAVKRSQGAEVLFNWGDASGASSHLLRSDTRKDGPLDRILASAGSGSPGLQLPMPPEPLLFLKVTGTSCKGEGPE